MLGGLLVPLRALVVALAGAGIAWIWYEEPRWVGSIDQGWFAFIPPIAVAVFLGFIPSWLGGRLLPEHPVWAVRLLPTRVFFPIGIAALAAGIAIIITVELTLPEGTATDTKETVGALATGVTAFLTSAFIDWTSDGTDTRVADYVHAKFQAAYTGYFRPGTVGERLVFSEYDPVSGWSGPARRERATKLADAIKSGDDRS
jgi:hypothetical protein